MDEAHGALAWQTGVARALAKKVDHLLVLSSTVGRLSTLPANTEVITPPVRPLGIPHRFGGRFAFNKHVFELCRERRIDAVVIHMAMEWAYILSPTFRFLRLPVVMWYAHGTVSQRLRLAIRCVDRVITSTPGGCRIRSEKIRVIGQAIDTDHFRVPQDRSLQNVVYVGRISPRKRIDLLYGTSKALTDANGLPEIPFHVVGPLLSLEDLHYAHSLQDTIWREQQEGNFRMMGFVPYARLPELYESAFLHLNVSETGSMDKTVMEGLSAGCPVLTSNPAFIDTLQDYPEFIARDDRPEAIAEQIRHIYERRRDYDPLRLRALVDGRHDMNSYADRVLNVVRERMVK